jgi:two-component system response regulator YesN
MLKVIVVEDEELVRKGIVLTVDWAAIGCMVVGEAPNGQEGLALVRRYSPDLVVTDIRMPVMDGVEMIRRLREEGQSRLEFIILSAHSDFSYARNAIKLGVADYLLKPFKDGELEAAVAAVRQRTEETDAAQGTGEPPLLRFEPEKGDRSKYVELAIAYIREHYSDLGLSINDTAGHLGISEGYLSRIFKKETDYTFVSYLTNFRIRAAMELLKNVKVKVYEVAAQVGYLDATYFSTLFKRLTGVSPSEYQNRSR